MIFNSKNFIAKKSLGQNFLHAPHVVGTMIHEAKIEAESHVLEVGPGKGVLTEELLAAGAHVIAVEKDDRAVEYLQEKFSREIKEGNLRLVRGDILDFDHGNRGNGGLVCGEYIIAANIPYYITGEFLRKFLDSACQPKRMILMLQKEVAQRITLEKKGSILSMSVRAYGHPSYITTVPARHFRPIPNVDSAILLIDDISKGFFKSGFEGEIPGKNGTAKFESLFFSVIKAGFAHKRKILIKNLENSPLLRPKKSDNADNGDILQKIWLEKGFSKKIRAEELSLENWKDIVLALMGETSADSQ